MEGVLIRRASGGYVLFLRLEIHLVEITAPQRSTRLDVTISIMIARRAGGKIKEKRKDGGNHASR